MNTFFFYLVFVFFIINIPECIKIRNPHLHMHNNVNKSNIYDIGAREKHGENVQRNNSGNVASNRGIAILYVSNKNKQMQCFISKGTKIFNNFFKNNKAKTSDVLKKNTIENDLPSCYNLSLTTASNAVSCEIADSLQENFPDGDSTGNSFSINESYVNELGTNRFCDNIVIEHNNTSQRKNKSWDHFFTDDYSDYEETNTYTGHLSDSNLNYDSMKTNNKNGEAKKEHMKLNKSEIEKKVPYLLSATNISKFQANRDDVSDGTFINIGFINRFSLKKKPRRNLNKLFSTYKVSNNFILKKKNENAGISNVSNTQEVMSTDGSLETSGIVSFFPLKSLGSSKEDIVINNIDDIDDEDTSNNGMNGDDNNVNNNNNNDNKTKNFNNTIMESTRLLSYEEKKIIKQKAHDDYVRYIKQRREPYFHLLNNRNDRIIKTLLIANNGMAALKCILSLKEWLFKTFYDENLIKIVVLATEDDIKSKTKYISLADKVIKVPSGKNINNYANVNLIVDIAKKEKVDAVWPGWGHCSENPLLSKLLENEGIIFMGPTDTVMEALGDKISANILAQSVNVPVVSWSGDNITVNNFDKNISADVYDRATVHSLAECLKECKRIGFPIMIKASQGGGGKGIRKVESEKEVQKAYEQVQNELPGSPIFLMKVCNNVRHIEIQVVGDMYGNVCSLSGRDCTTQRRFQKIFEEGPPRIVPKKVFREMEKSSLRLTKMIKYRGAGTVEYLYDQVTHQYYFLELNPRLQVEHPVSEGITNTNLISIQLQLAMGIPLQNIEDIRKLYRVDEKQNQYYNTMNFDESCGTSSGNVNTSTNEKTTRINGDHISGTTLGSLNAGYSNEQKSHKIRILHPGSNEINIAKHNSSNTNNTSISSSFNTLMNISTNASTSASTNTAIGASVISTSKNSSVNNTIDSSQGISIKCIPFFDFYNNEPNVSNYVIAARITAENSNDSFKPTSGKVQRINFQNSTDVWGYFSINEGSVHEFSDSQIGHIFAKGATREIARKNLILSLRKLQIDGEIKTVTKYLAKILESKAFQDNNITTNWLDTVIQKKKTSYYNTYHIIVLCATIFKLLSYFMKEKETEEEKLNRDDIAIKIENDKYSTLRKHQKKSVSLDLLFENVKYCFTGYNIGDNLYKLIINNQEIEVLAEYDKQNNRVFANFHKHTYIYNCVEDSLGIHMDLEKDNIFIPKLTNPLHLISNTNGKIVRYLINDGEQVSKNEDYVEVEAMKMIMTFKSTETGILKHKKSAGSIIKMGDLLGEIVKEGDSNSKQSTEKNGEGKTEDTVELFKGHLNLSNKHAYEKKVNTEELEFEHEYEDKYEPSAEMKHVTTADLYKSFRVMDKERNDKYRKEEPIKDAMFTSPSQKTDDGIIEVDDTMFSKERTSKNRLYLKQKKKNIFRLFSCKHIDANKIMPLNSLIDRGNSTRQYFNVGDFTRENSNVPMKMQQENKAGDVTNSDTAHASDIEKNNEVRNELNSRGAHTENQVENKDPLLVDASKQINSGDTNESVKQIQSDKEKDHGKENEETTHFLLDIKNMDRVNYLLKGYEQNVEECFHKLVTEPNMFININIILEKFIEYNNLFTKKENITEVEVYDILYNSVTDKKKQYEIIHAYTYNNLSIQLVERIIMYLIKNKISELPENIRTNLQVLAHFKGKNFGQIAATSRFLIYLADTLNTTTNLKNILTRNSLDEHKKNELNQFIEANNFNYENLIELLQNKDITDLEKMVNIFFKNSKSIHSFLPFLFTYSTNCPFLELYLRNLYKYHNIKIKWVNKHMVKFALHDDTFNNVIILNKQTNGQEQQESFIRNSVNQLTTEAEKGESFDTIHIVHMNGPFMKNIEGQLKDIMQNTKQVYIYDYTGNNYGKVTAYDKRVDETYLEAPDSNNLLPFEKSIISLEDILKYYNLKNIEEGTFYKTKLFLGMYKTDLKKNSLFAHKIIDMHFLKHLNEYISKDAEEKHTFVDPIQHQFANMTDSLEEQRLYSNLLKELKETLEEIEVGRNTPHVKDAKTSSYITYHIIIDDVNQIEKIKKVLINFVNMYNELLLENYVNGVYIKLFRRKENKKENRKELFSEIQFEQMWKLHVLFQEGKEIIEQVGSYSSFEIDNLYTKRKRARDVDTIYAYDFIRLLDVSLNRMNKQAGQDFKHINSIKEFKLNYLVDKEAYSTEEKINDLFEHYDNVSAYEEKIKRALYLSNKIDVGQNKMSVIALLINMKTDAYKQGRDVVLIMNDISTSGGSFSIMEDELFYAVSAYAREKKIPRIYISCNSGARIGLYNFLMDKIKISWKNENKKELGYDYLYITEEVKNQLPKDNIVFLNKIEENNETRYIIDGVVGNLKNPIGVENLRGSGLIAGETSKAYEEIFTLSYVTGRSVGIGAYLVRLGKRVIQKTGSSLLLTGFNALNKLLGEQVYVSNEQLGGVNIMTRNGISQLQAANDQDGVDKIIKWLSYVPKTSEHYFDVLQQELGHKINNESFHKDSGGVDFSENDERLNTIEGHNVNNNTHSKKLRKGNKTQMTIEQERQMHPTENYTSFTIPKINDVEIVESENVNTIDLIKGTKEKQGFLDKDSYFEYMNEWGKGIITGRGTLGSVPVGFIAVNKNLVTQITPCDPALKIKSVKSPQAPCVFFPDNSYKTAQAIEDFNIENLPLFIFANWRGFSGGSMDMFNSILKFGSMIVNQLVNYKHPVFVYIPIHGELRGGSWVVVDETLNDQIIEMYADTTSRGGILEPPGIVEIKFRIPEIKKLMHNIDNTLIELDKKLVAAQGDDVNKITKNIEEKEKELLPFYLQACHKYADLHDVAACMNAKGVIKKIVPWEKSRSFFYYRLLRRLIVKTLSKQLSNDLVKEDEVKKIIEDKVGDEKDDYEACKKILNEDTMKPLKEITSDLTYQKAIINLQNTFKILTPKDQMQLVNQIKSMRS